MSQLTLILLRPEWAAGERFAYGDAAYVSGSIYFVDSGLTWFYQE